MPHGGMFLFLGADRPRKLQRIRELERSLGVEPLDAHRLEGRGLEPSALIALCRQRPALSRARLVIVDDAQRLDAVCIDALQAHATAIAATTCLVLLVDQDLSVRHPLAKPPPAIHIERFPGREAPAAAPFALTDALGRRDAVGALAAARDQLVGGKEPVELLALIGWQVSRWTLVRRLLDAGYGTERIASALALRPWQAQRLESEVAPCSLERLQDALRRCWELDGAAKSGKAVPVLAVEQLVLELCSSTAAVR